MESILNTIIAVLKLIQEYFYININKRTTKKFLKEISNNSVKVVYANKKDMRPNSNGFFILNSNIITILPCIAPSEYAKVLLHEYAHYMQDQNALTRKLMQVEQFDINVGELKWHQAWHEMDAEYYAYSNINKLYYKYITVKEYKRRANIIKTKRDDRYNILINKIAS